MLKHEPELLWLNDSSITGLEFDYRKERLHVYYKKDGKDYHDEAVMGTDFKPFIHYSTNDKTYNIVRHGETYKSVRSIKTNFSNVVLLPPETQFLIQAKRDLFENVALSDMKIIVFDIETTSLDPKAGEILSIGILGNYKFRNGENTYFCKNEPSEKYLLMDFVDFMREEDPDIVIGHNVFEFDIPFIESRMEQKGIDATLGRDGGWLVKDYYPSKVNRLIAGSDFFQYKIPGRHIVDTMHLAMIEDTRRHEFESYGLKWLAQHLGVAPKDRVYLDGGDIKNVFKTDFDKFMKYLTDDLSETMGLAKLFLPAYFHMSKIIPIPLQAQVYAGATKKFTALFVGDYYHAEKGLPMAQEKRQFQGALTSAEEHGIFMRVGKWDVSSLYPSTMRYRNFVPQSDTLGVFKKYLIKFMEERLEYKYKAEEVETSDPKLYEEYFAYQLALKILINSFYGVLGTPGFIFNDYDMAEAVTTYGREVLNKMVNFLRAEDCTVIEIDTDGVYFTYPDGKDPYKLLEELNSQMDEGIKIDFEKKFKSMLSYKDKTYVLMPENYPKKKLTIKGSAFRKRGMQPYLKKWLATSFEKLLTFDPVGYEDNCYLVERALGQKEMDIEEVVESKKISFDYKHYIARPTGGKIAHFEAMRKEGREKDFLPGDKVSFYYHGDTLQKQKSDMVKLYNEGEKVNDYNCDYYINKLQEWKKVFEPFYEQIKKGS